MKYGSFMVAIVLTGTMLVPVSATAEGDQAAYTADARKVTKQFMGSLKQELVSAMKAGGPLKAIPVCNEKAPQITLTASDSSGWRVGRTSHKLRNPNNAPDDWERTTMEAFLKQRAEGADPKSLEKAEITDIDGKKAFRFMKAIPTAEACVICHGSKISDEVSSKLNELYPEDQARGFKPGDLRGAFTLVKYLD